MEEKTAMKNAPKKIYLQVDPEDENPDFLDDDSGITWSTGKVHETDIEYVLPAPQREDGFLKALDNRIEKVDFKLANDINLANPESLLTILNTYKFVRDLYLSTLTKK